MNKRYFDDETVIEAYRQGGIENVKKLIGKTEIFIYHNESSIAKKAIDLVIDNKLYKAGKLLQSCT